jgi:hypothetical protein
MTPKTKIDTREQQPYEFENLEAGKGTLYIPKDTQKIPERIITDIVEGGGHE